MDRWCERFMADWLTDDDNHGVIEDPDSLQFMKDVLAALKSFQEDKDKTTAKSTALSIAAKINSVPETKARYVLQKYHAVLSGAAASNSPLDPSDLAEITYWFAQELSPQLAERFQIELTWNAREDWNEPNPDYQGNTRDRQQRIQDWIRLNQLSAHLARTHTAPPIQNLGSLTLSLAFGGNETPDPVDMLDFHVPAAAAWIHILGKEIYQWSVGEVSDYERKYFDPKTWDVWKKGFERCWKSEEMHPQLKSVAEKAWRAMCDLEKKKA